jgi:hypothetical protein
MNASSHSLHIFESPAQTRQFLSIQSTQVAVSRAYLGSQIAKTFSTVLLSSGFTVATLTIKRTMNKTITARAR